MLPVSTVYIAWKHGDMVDAYLSGHQVLFITKVSPYSYNVRYMDKRGNWWISGLCYDTKLEIREDVEGIVA